MNQLSLQDIERVLLWTNTLFQHILLHQINANLTDEKRNRFYSENQNTKIILQNIVWFCLQWYGNQIIRYLYHTPFALRPRHPPHPHARYDVIPDSRRPARAKMMADYFICDYILNTEK